MKLEEVRPQAVLRGVVPGGVVTVVGVQWYGSESMEMTYKTAAGAVANELLYRHDEGPDVRAHLTRVVEDAFDRDRLRDLLEERALAQDAMNTSRVPATGKLRFIEVKGRAQDKATITVTCNEILYSLNKPDDFILAIVEFLEDGSHRVRYLRRPFRREPDFGVTSVNYDFPELLARAEDPA